MAKYLRKFDIYFLFKYPYLIIIFFYKGFWKDFKEKHVIAKYEAGEKFALFFGIPDRKTTCQYFFPFF